MCESKGKWSTVYVYHSYKYTLDLSLVSLEIMWQNQIFHGTPITSLCNFWVKKWNKTFGKIDFHLHKTFICTRLWKTEFSCKFLGCHWVVGENMMLPDWVNGSVCIGTT
jgi:hypothetical protein